MYCETFVTASKRYLPAIEGEGPLNELHNNYLKEIDPDNRKLQESSFMLDTFMNYIHLFSSPEEPASYEELDPIIALVRDSDLAFQKTLLYQLWGQLVLEERIEAANYLAESYLIFLSKTLGDQDMATMLTNFMNTSVGQIAPDFSWKNEEGDKEQTFSALNSAEKYILVFWSSACSHCMKELPNLQKALVHVPQEQYQVVAVGLEDEPYDWKNETYRYPRFVHVLGLGKWENEIGNLYGVSGTPTYLVLDKDKKILAKPESFEELYSIIHSKTPQE